MKLIPALTDPLSIPLWDDIMDPVWYKIKNLTRPPFWGHVWHFIGDVVSEAVEVPDYESY